MRRLGAVISAIVVAVAAALGLATDNLRPHDGQRVPSVAAGESLTTSLARVDLHAVERDAETVSVDVTIEVTAGHPVPVRDVLGFEVDGDLSPFFTRSNGVPVAVLNPRVPVRATISYDPAEGERVVRPVIVDGIWQTQDENALLLPDHLVLRRVVAVIEP